MFNFIHDCHIGIKSRNCRDIPGQKLHVLFRLPLEVDLAGVSAVVLVYPLNRIRSFSCRNHQAHQCVVVRVHHVEEVLVELVDSENSPYLEVDNSVALVLEMVVENLVVLVSFLVLEAESEPEVLLMMMMMKVLRQLLLSLSSLFLFHWLQ